MNPLRSVLARALLLALLSVVLPACSTWECTAQTCADGCCDADDVCQVGNVDRACGLQGRSCQTCTSAQTCGASGQCVSKCNAQNCPNGCCDEYGSCRTTQTSFTCGRGGATCVDCNAGGSYTKSCEQGACCTNRYNPCTTSTQCCLGLSCRTDFDSTLKCL
jgi:hypothetical protein